MKRIMNISLGLALLTMMTGCGEEWACQTKGKSMFSMSSSGKIGSADKGCSCDEIRNFELEQFGRVDEAALKSDFGC